MNVPEALRFPRGLYGITPEWADDSARLFRAVEAAARGGMVALQWRQKTLAPSRHEEKATELAKLCRTLGILFIVNDSIDLALRTDADGVHLGRDDDALDQARQTLGPGKIIGCSCYNEPERVRQALAADVDYVAFGAMYPSTIKPDAVRATLDTLRAGNQIVAAVPSPTRPAIVAIGGITPDNAAPVIDAGADSIALISALFESDDIELTALRCSRLFNR